MNLKNHVCTDKAVNGVKFTAKIIDQKGAKNSRTLAKLQSIYYIVVHNAGNTAPTAGDENHAAYLQNVENADATYLSWHVTTDADSATQHLPFDEVGYHAGDGTGPGNHKGIGIEIAENRDYPACESNGIKIICALMHDYKIPIDRVLPHRYFSSVKKLCPWRILKSQVTWQSDWKAFQARIQAVYNGIYGGAASPEIPTPAPPAASVKVNGVVQFAGGGVYKAADAATAVHTRPASRCKVTRIVTGKHPYHLVSEDDKGVYGWVDADRVTTAAESYTVKVAGGTNYRKGPGTNYAVAGTISAGGVYTITEEADGAGGRWGKLLSGAGWISLVNVQKV